MEVILYTELNAFALIILFIIYINLHHKKGSYPFEQKLFLLLIIFNGLLLLTDSFMWILNGLDHPLFRWLNHIDTTFYYILNPVICMVWSLYVDFHIFRNEKRFKRLFVLLLIPVMVNTVLSVLSNFYNILFYIDIDNHYYRGDYILIVAAISYFYLMYSAIFIFVNKEKIHKPHIKPLLFFMVPPFIGGILQLLCYGLSLIWICITISILFVFINIQNEQMYTDYLTGLYNRRQLDNYLNELILRGKKRTLIAGIMIDLNSFKSINDQFGHYVGDEALKYTAMILKNTFCNDDFIYRFGGDEFVVLLELAHPSELNTHIQHLNENVAVFNSKKSLSYEISLSIGAAVYDAASAMSVDDFIKHIDLLMYQDKSMTVPIHT